MARNKVQFQKGMSETQFDGMYGTDALCHAALVRWRWPEGFTCPGCEGRKHCIVKRGARILYQCNACRKQTSVTAGTIFASSKLRLRLWFKSMYLLTQSKKGVSSLELGRRLGVTQTTAWTLKHKLAQVMMERNAAKRLKGDVQMDDAYIGGSRPGTCGRGAAGGSAALPASPRQDAPIARSRPAAERKRPKTRASNGSTPSLATSRPQWWEPTEPCGPKHVPRYLAEFEYRFNRRYRLETMIDRLAYVSLRTAPMPYRLLKLADVYA